MRFVGFKEIAVKAIVLDAVDIRKRQEQQHVKDLADDAEQNGGEYMHPPVVRTDGHRLIAGRDRMAGALLKKRKRIWVHLAECDDDEAKALELAENLYRRPLDKDQRAQAIAALVRLREQQHRLEDEAKRAAGETVSEAPQNSPKARARREVAKTAGVTQATVKSHEKRTRKSAEEAENGIREPGAVPPPAAQPAATLPEGFQAFSLEVSDERKDSIRATAEWLAELEGLSRKVSRDLTDMEKRGIYAVSHAAAQLIKERAAALGHAIREAIPTSLCFYCKGRPDLVVSCNGCGQTGVAGRHGGDNAPPELKSLAPVYVAENGGFVPYHSDVAPTKRPSTKKSSKRITVEDEHGRELTYVPDEEGPAL